MYNPNFYYQNPYMQPIQPQIQPQAQPQQTQMPGMNGRVVDNFDSITVNEIPMTGFSVFPKTDLSEIVVKRWSPNGTIENIHYKAHKDDLIPKTANSSTEDTESLQMAIRSVTDGLKEDIQSINSKIDKLIAKKKGASDES